MSKTCTIGHPLHFGHFPFHAASSLFHTRESSSSLGITHQKGNPQRVLSTNLLGGREYDMKRSSLIYEPSVRYFYCHIQALYMNLTRGAAKGWGSLDTASRSDTSTLECYKTRLPLNFPLISTIILVNFQSRPSLHFVPLVPLHHSQTAKRCA